MIPGLGICLYCKYYSTTKLPDWIIKDIGWCKRRSPEISTSVADMSHTGRWPLVTMDDGCGDWEFRNS